MSRTVRTNLEALAWCRRRRAIIDYTHRRVIVTAVPLPLPLQPDVSAVGRTLVNAVAILQWKLGEVVPAAAGETKGGGA